MDVYGCTGWNRVESYLSDRFLNATMELPCAHNSREKSFRTHGAGRHQGYVDVKLNEITEQRAPVFHAGGVRRIIGESM